MERYTKVQRLVMVKTHYKHGECYAETVRKLPGIFGRQNAPNQSTVQRLVKKFEETGSIVDIKSPGRARARRSLENIAVVRQSVDVSPGKSIRRRSQELAIPRSTMQRLLKKRSASPCLQASTDARTQANRPYEAPRICQLDVGKPKSGRRFLEENHL
jgi:transposase